MWFRPGSLTWTTEHAPQGRGGIGTIKGAKSVRRATRCHPNAKCAPAPTMSTVLCLNIARVAIPQGLAISTALARAFRIESVVGASADLSALRRVDTPEPIVLAVNDDGVVVDDAGLGRSDGGEEEEQD